MKAASRTSASRSWSSERSRSIARGSSSAAIARQTSTRAGLVLLPAQLQQQAEGPRVAQQGQAPRPAQARVERPAGRRLQERLVVGVLQGRVVRLRPCASASAAALPRLRLRPSASASRFWLAPSAGRPPVRRADARSSGSRAREDLGAAARGCDSESRKAGPADLRVGVLAHAGAGRLDARLVEHPRWKSRTSASRLDVGVLRAQGDQVRLGRRRRRRPIPGSTRAAWRTSGVLASSASGSRARARSSFVASASRAWTASRPMSAFSAFSARSSGPGRTRPAVLAKAARRRPMRTASSGCVEAGFEQGRGAGGRLAEQLGRQERRARGRHRPDLLGDQLDGPARRRSRPGACERRLAARRVVLRRARLRPRRRRRGPGATSSPNLPAASSGKTRSVLSSQAATSRGAVVELRPGPGRRPCRRRP